MQNGNGLKKLFDHNFIFYLVLFISIVITLILFLYSNINFLKNYTGQFFAQARDKVKRIIELHNGSIWAESEGIGKGSVFCFTIGTDKTEPWRTEHAG
jgi:hypothetical protein